MRPTRLGVAWTAAALLGIVVTAALTWSVSRLAGQRIGLSSAPPSAISGLAPVRPARHIAGAAPDPAPSQPAPSQAARAQAGTPPATSTPVSPTTTAVGPTHAAPPAPAPAAGTSPVVATTAAAPSRSSGGEDGGDGHGANARSGGGHDD